MLWACSTASRNPAKWSTDQIDPALSIRVLCFINREVNSVECDCGQTAYVDHSQSIIPHHIYDICFTFTLFLI